MARSSKKSKRSTKPKKMTRSARDKKIIQQKQRMHKRIRQEMGTPQCRQGELVKEGYKRKSYTRKTGNKAHVKSATVAPSCMPGRGRSHKGKQLFVLEKGTLGKYGYHNVESMTEVQRHRALHKAMGDMPSLSVYRKLNAVYVVNKSLNPNVAQIFKNDAEWVKSTTEYKHRPTA